MITLGIVGPGQIIVVLVIVLLFFGGKKIPELMKGLGQGVKEFKDASKGDEKEAEVKENPADSNLEQK
jgi:sec-independent protein translocase protein TatA